LPVYKLEAQESSGSFCQQFKSCDSVPVRKKGHQDLLLEGTKSVLWHEGKGAVTG